MSRFCGPQYKGALRDWKAGRSKAIRKELEERRLKEAKQQATDPKHPHNWVHHPDGKLEIICANTECAAVWKPNRPRPPMTKCPQAAKVSTTGKTGSKQQVNKARRRPQRDKRIMKNVKPEKLEAK